MNNKGIKGPIFIYPSNNRAEDRSPRTTPWNDLCDEVLVPVGSLVLVLLVCTVVIVLS